MTIDRGLTLRELREFLNTIPSEHEEREVLVSFNAGYAREGVVARWEIDQYDQLIVHSTGDVFPDG